MSSSIIGADVTRIDGRLKVTGAATYAGEHAIANRTYGIPVVSTVGSGTVSSIDTPRRNACREYWQFCITATLSPCSGRHRVRVDGPRRRNPAAFRRHPYRRYFAIPGRRLTACYLSELFNNGRLKQP